MYGRCMMQNNKKRVYKVITVLMVLWLVFVILHVLLTGKLFLWNIMGSLPPIAFLAIPLLFLASEFFLKKRSLIRIISALIAVTLGFTQADLNLFPLVNLQTNVVKADNATNITQYVKIKVVDWNTCFWDQNKNDEQYYRLLKKQKADIYLLQEYLYDAGNLVQPQKGETTKVDRSRRYSICSVMPGFPPRYWAVDDISRLVKEFPGYYIRTNLQFVLISRYPIKEAFTDYSEQFAVYDVDIAGKTIRFFNVHMLLHVELGNPLTAQFYRGLRQRYLAQFTNRLYVFINYTPVSFARKPHKAKLTPYSSRSILKSKAKGL